MKHTPGPWKVSPFDEWDKTIEIGSFCWVDYDDCDHDEMKANAKLIAAAPDLLAACKQTISLMESYFNYNPATQNMREAIAKAEGK